MLHVCQSSNKRHTKIDTPIITKEAAVVIIIVCVVILRLQTLITY